MLKSVDVQKLDQTDILLLEDLSHSSEDGCHDLLKTNFAHLISTFKMLKLEFDELFEEDIGTKKI